MGKVYEAGHLRLARKRYAVKLLKPGTADDEEAYARFRREAEIATEIGHPHIVDVHDFNITEEGQPFIVMELLEGEDLFDRCKRVGRLPAHEIVQIIRQVADALKAAHNRGIVHRDLKPENIFLPRSEGELQVKLLDFGLSKIKNSRSRLTRQNAVFGTPDYMAPEQASGRGADVDHRADIFALAVIVYQCLSGQLPFESSTPLGVLYRVCNEQPTPLSQMVTGLPAQVDVVMARAMAKRCEERYDSAEQFVEELARALEGTPTSVALAMPGVVLPAGGRISAGEIRSLEGEPQLPPGAPPLPQDALEPVERSEPSVMVDQAMLPSIHDLQTAEVHAVSGGIHQLDTVRRKPFTSGGVQEVSDEELAPQSHDMSTADEDPLPVTEDLLATGTSGATTPYGRTPVEGRQRFIAYLVMTLILTVVGVGAVWLAFKLAAP